MSLSACGQRRPRMRRGSIAQPGHRAHRFGQLDGGPERPSQPQRGPGALERAGGAVAIAERHRAPACRHQVVEVGAGAFDRRDRPQRGEPARRAAACAAVSACGPLPAIAAFGLQVLGGVDLHADQQVEAVVAARAHE